MPAADRGEAKTAPGVMEGSARPERRCGQGTWAGEVLWWVARPANGGAVGKENQPPLLTRPNPSTFDNRVCAQFGPFSAPSLLPDAKNPGPPTGHARSGLGQSEGPEPHKRKGKGLRPRLRLVRKAGRHGGGVN